MHMALPIDNWLEQNALFCNRYHARMAPGVCDCNRGGKEAARCDGCNGLEDQQRESPRREPVVFFSEPDPEEPLTAEEEETELDGLELEGLDITLEEDALNDFHLGLLALLEDDLEEPEEQISEPEKKGPRRFAVYEGRCPRCTGYMVNDPEHYDGIRDDNLYRCYSCSFRISPAYQWNRLQRAEGR